MPVPDQPYQRHHTAVCDDAALGIFMKHLTQFLAGAKQPARFIDDTGIERDGIAYTWDQWADDLGLTQKQFRRVLEKAERLGYIVRARKTWGKYRQMRLHVAVTTAYVDELTRCVTLGTKAYLKATRAARQPHVHNSEGQDDVAHLGNTMLPTEGNTMLPTEGNFIEDSSLTLSETLSDTAVAADAGDAQPRPFGESPPIPEKTMTVTSHGLATKLSALGLLVEWQRLCAVRGTSVADVNDEQLDGLVWWYTKTGGELSRWDREQRMSHLVENWDEFASAMCNADDVCEHQLQAPQRPCLEFLRQVVAIIRGAPEKPSSVDKPIASMQSIAPKKTSLAAEHGTPATLEELLALEADEELQAAS